MAGQVTGRLLKASGKMEDSASQALAWRVGCSADCRARGRGPLSIAVQNITTWNKGTVRTRDNARVGPAEAMPTRPALRMRSFAEAVAFYKCFHWSSSTVMEISSEITSHIQWDTTVQLS